MSRYTRHNILLHKGDYSILQTRFGANTATFLRGVIRREIKRLSETPVEPEEEINLDMEPKNE